MITLIKKKKFMLGTLRAHFLYLPYQYSTLHNECG